MKSTVVLKEKRKSFPKLMVSDEGRIVLFSSENVGTVIGGNDRELGRHDETWIMSKFEDFDETVILEN